MKRVDVDEDRCTAVKHAWPMSFQDHGKRGLFKHRAKAPNYSQDGKCGPNNGNLLCDPNSTAYKGTCCSSYGQSTMLAPTELLN